MPKPISVERDLLVFAIWSVSGVAGLAFLIEGFANDSYYIALVGIAIVVAGFIAHMIVNAVLRTSFGAGETVLGIGVFGILALSFIAGWARGALSEQDYWSGLTFFAVIGTGLPIYLATRHGMRGAFSHFHIGRSDDGGEGA